ncbi:MAG: nuclear transport factor 2 family protein [Verrucomicrobiota bacterium]
MAEEDPTQWAAVKELDEVNEALVEAYVDEDVEALRGFLAANHVHNNVFGFALGKEAFLSDIETGVLEFLRYETPVIQWVVEGDLAVATGVIEAEAVRDGKTVPATRFRFTRVFVKEEGRWKVLLFHNTMIPKET